ncbi:lipoprotein-releasing system permease protein [Sphingobium sp. B1D7B]|uniref:lipoprotein-releasing ABC transporter permease subunit n=1 Tax=Sphingobium TaxID=165695 RepID=UPI0015EB5AF8|nr:MULTISPECIES: lipoprotein-releasing ABC transporter permease subunit [Sphingobium]MCW2361953.1 lipoprotein-releasing system permease protein [Sphingobium sp. B10D3B]MCW2390621.1 lipoprotein-releasing system permease protein [Sphingobium sp. B11D3A]MCW2401368.1 lipoprotein-releasing system permease protein [Sphingobium sp. B10D7B]MCW2405762.1 lipoprotein-releasing system permease protein [Sphingobium sp. B1D7B]MCW2408348.1 lipoprotein-releasing system permease protein [Sphingobium xanthum]
MILNRYERMIARRYLLPGKGEGFIFLVASISLVAVMLGVGALIVVMSVMNGFRAELFDKIVGLNGHAVVQGYGGRLDNWEEIARQSRATPGVTSATPLIEQPLLATFNGRVEAALIRGMTEADIHDNASLSGKVLAGSLKDVRAGSGKVAIGSRLAEALGVGVGQSISVINPAGRSTPFGTVPRQLPYEIGAIFEIGIYDYDKAFVIMPMQDAQTLLLMGDKVGMVELQTEDPDRVGEILAPLTKQVATQGQVIDWRQMNASLFEALQVDRVVSFVILSLIILVAVFNILSSLIMLVRAKTRDIAILRTMGATRASLLRIFVTVGVTIGTLGTGAGLVLGSVILFFRQGIVDGVQMLTGQQLWDPSIRFLTSLPSKPDPVEIGAICIMAVGFSFLATLYPAFKAANTDPVQVLRYE